MSNEEIIARLEGMKGNGYKEQEQAIDEAIEIIKSYPCEDAVSRQAVLEITAETGALETQARVKALPPVTPKQRTGKWIRHTRVKNVYDIAGVKTWGIKHQCDQCTFTTIAIEDFGYYDYCPHCGAKMEGE